MAVNNCCVFCESGRASATDYHPIHFNGKIFRYVRCADCGLVYITPLPTADDYQAMYPPSYQGNEVAIDVLADPGQKLPGLRFSYARQYEVIRAHCGPDAHILDYGCGNGHFIANALAAGFSCTGAEFDPGYVAALAQALPAADFVTIAGSLSGTAGVTYDVIRLSNVLEHISTPVSVMSRLSGLLKPGGIFLVEGPLEENVSPAWTVKRFYFKLGRMVNPKRFSTLPPYHIFLSNRKNQERFFERLGLVTSLYVIEENAWPLPPRLRDAAGVKGKTMALLALLSIRASSYVPNWGNTFLYAGSPGVDAQ